MCGCFSIVNYSALFVDGVRLLTLRIFCICILICQWCRSDCVSLCNFIQAHCVCGMANWSVILFIAPLLANTAEDRPAKEDYQTVQLLGLILELLSFCVEHHTYHIKNCVFSKDLLRRVLVLMKSTHTFLVLCKYSYGAWWGKSMATSLPVTCWKLIKFLHISEDPESMCILGHLSSYWSVMLYNACN
jgi:hypothetical protein